MDLIIDTVIGFYNTFLILKAVILSVNLKIMQDSN